MFFKRISLCAAAMVAASAMVLSGCSSSDAGVDDSESTSASPTSFVTPRTMPAGKGSGAADGVFPRTVKHFKGETDVAAAPKRVVVISTGQADALLTLGVVPVGSTSGDGAALVPKYLYNAFPDRKAELDRVADVGSRFEPSLEAVANLKPDLILMNKAGKDSDKLYASLAAMAPTVVTQGTGLYWKQDLLLLADALGKRDQAQTWLDEYQNDAADFGKTVDGSPTVSFLRKNGDRLRVFGVASFSGSVAEDAGLARPQTQWFTDETSHDISNEQLDQADADWIFYGVQGGDTGAVTGAPLWKTLQAVSDEHAVAVDDDVFYLNVGPTAAREVLDQLRAKLGR
ncbi:ABC transporter substrate-binding protein [Gordonia hydrophobica]|uniref:Iron-siderophore ABC transporter substrate-binding protein n=1 Tax=Gordonia hydrophobica TaxID=40516 RepID=A0ABZ2U668_9ACTN|nr:iron-siderophore ABC transporter substrate-binding protein [Gordonia hydrophobica]MBM7365466.1 iron complex transport system substrate-binding protein [Gordonia hydrophobica]